ncbi:MULTISPECIES: GspH/FimT family protein [Gammaproteobacteria]|uniref:GspH/FimT family protein n=1 Tax=Gammaproteobacteria TaxID=1236 RepID=UPI003A93CEAA
MAPVPQRMAGLTLLELLITITILTITISLSAPTLMSVVSENQLSTTTKLLARTVSFSKAEAIKRGRRVVMCLSKSTTACDSEAAKYVLVFEDSDQTGNPTQDKALVRTLKLNASVIAVSYNRSFLAFSSRGYASGTNGTFKICHRNGNGELLVISTLGRARQAVDYDGDGLVDKVPGQPISC